MMTLYKLKQILEMGTIIIKGGPGSGHHGHAGRPGQQGGSAAGSGSSPWNTSANTGPEAKIAKQAIRDRWNSPARFSVREQRWKPRMNSSQDDAMRSLGKAWAKHESGQSLSAVPFSKIDGRVLNSLRKREWVNQRVPKLTTLGVEAVQEFWPQYLR